MAVDVAGGRTLTVSNPNMLGRIAVRGALSMRGATKDAMLPWSGLLRVGRLSEAGTGQPAGDDCATGNAQESWDLIHAHLLDWLARGGEIDWPRAVVGRCSVRAGLAENRPARIPTDRSQAKQQTPLICDSWGMPLAIRLTGANSNDSQEASPLVDAIHPYKATRGHRGVGP